MYEKLNNDTILLVYMPYVCMENESRGRNKSGMALYAQQDYIGITPFTEEPPDVSYDDNSELSQYGMVAADGDGSDTVKMR